MEKMNIDKLSEIPRLLEAKMAVEVLKDSKIKSFADQDIKKKIFACYVHKFIIENQKQ
ncbi:hypothetical protein HZS_1867, partial [Henneguya salminicola]